MENSFESHVQHTFDSYCRTVVRNEARNIKKKHNRLKERQISIDYLSQAEKDTLYYHDRNINNSEKFYTDGIEIIVQDTQLSEAISQLPKELKRIILLFYFVGLNDREIGEKFNTSAGCLWSRRKRAIRIMHNYMEENCDEKL